MANYRFNLILEGDLNERATEKLAEGGCQDMTFGMEAGVPYATVSMDGDSPEQAKADAIRRINESGSGIKVVEGLALPEKEKDDEE